MGFNYHKHKGDGGGDSMWTSYSDLFLGLSIIFLLLYVTSSLKQGTDGVKQFIENKRLVKESEDLKQQIKVFETLKQDYLNQQASQDEKETYEELMSKLTLLQDEAKDEKNKLLQQAKENEKKANALNKYQAMVRNIINQNLVQKGRIKTRDTMIETKDEIITEKTTEISKLESTVSEKSNEIKKGETRIAEMEQSLDQRLNQLKNAYRAQKLTKKKYEQQQQALKKETEARIVALAEKNARAQQELDAASKELQQTSAQLADTKGKVEKLAGENEQLTGELQAASGKHKADLERMKGEFESQKGRERAAFEAQLAKEKLSGDARAAREAAFKAQAEKKAQELAGKMGELDKKFKESQGNLAKAQENLNAKKKLAEQIKKNFAAYGVKADVDANNGDVLLSFGDQYFDSGAANLKPKMRQILEQAMPAYSASLFENGKVAEKIQSVEIVGFASPTYKGKYIDPKNLTDDSRQAINYNLDLSYARARAIFNHVFDKNKMSFKHQERMLPLVKVTGRSFLAGDAKARDPATTGSEAFCRVNDCAKLQRVIIKFTLKD